jgi:ABC-type transporter Mla subunit MlaD
MLTQTQRLLTRLKYAAWQDVLLWAVVLAVGWLVIPKVWSKVMPKSPQAIALPFKDSSELSAGSPVRLMGTEVGWVHAVRMQKDHVQVKLRFYRDAPRIPPGALFTIEFSGIAGAKCIEITPPNVKNQGVGILVGPYRVVEPIRMSDVQKGGLLQVDAMREGALNTARLLGPDNLADKHLARVKQTNAALAQAEQNTAKAGQTLTRITTDLHTVASETSATLTEYARVWPTRQVAIKPKLDEALHTLNGSTATLTKVTRALKQPLPSATKQVTESLHAIPPRLQTLTTRTPALLQPLNTQPLTLRLQQASHALHKAPPALQRWQQGVQGVNRVLTRLNKTVPQPTAVTKTAPATPLIESMPAPTL